MMPGKLQPLREVNSKISAASTWSRDAAQQTLDNEPSGDTGYHIDALFNGQSGCYLICTVLTVRMDPD